MRPLRLLFDYYHHLRPGTKVGNHLVTGSWSGGAGRYGWDDFVHTNTFDPVFVALEKEFVIAMAEEPMADSLLAGADAVVILNPDNPAKLPEVPVISDPEIAALRRFVERGGSLMVMINSGGADREAEDFEGVQLRKLVRSFGLDWNSDDTHYSDVPIGAAHPYFYDVPVFHYGSGCTLQILPEARQPVVLMDVASDAGYPDRHVRGPGIVMVRSGKGKFILVGDTGSWTGNISRPWAENERVLKQLFRYLKPDLGVASPQFAGGKTWEYAVTVAGLQGVPVANTLSQVPRPHYRLFHPRKITGMPYLEGTAGLRLTCTERMPNQSAKLEARVTGFHWFDEATPADQPDTLHFIASRQGKVSGIVATGPGAEWLAPDMSALVALLPVDGLQRGDRWETEESLRIPILQGAGLAPVRPVTMDVLYAADTERQGRPCRLLRASGEIWLDALGVRVEDLLPADEMHRAGGLAYEYLAPRGGKLLYKREQWVAADTGLVVEARTQTRIVAWIHDRRTPIDRSNADKDNHMVTSLAQSVTFKLK